MIAQQILILVLKMIKQGQNKISRALIWDKVHLCRPNMTGDMIKNVKMVIFKKCQILHFLAFMWHKLTFFENHCFFFFIISLVIFGLKRLTLPQIKALQILFGPYIIIFSSKINICWEIMSRNCIIFFVQSLVKKSFWYHINYIFFESFKGIAWKLCLPRLLHFKLRMGVACSFFELRPFHFGILYSKGLLITNVWHFMKQHADFHEDISQA